MTAVVGISSHWVVNTSTLSEGSHTVSATVSDAAGNTVTATQVLTVDLTAPTLAINGGASALTADATPTISGTSDAVGRTVTVTVAGQTLTAVVGAGGTWSVTVATVVAGSHSVLASVTDAAGNTTTATQTLTVDVTAPTVSIDGGANAVATDATPTITGVSNAVGRTVTVTIAGQTLTATVASDGSWSVEVATIGRGVYVVSATVTDALMRTVSAHQSLDYLSVLPGIHNTTKAQTVQQGDGDPITVSGDGFVAGETVEVWLHSTPVMLGTLTADSAGFVEGIVNDTTTTPLGVHHIVFTGLTSGGSLNSLDITEEASATVIKTMPFTGFDPRLLLMLAGLVLLVGAILRLAGRVIQKKRQS
jgi:hypothetical protein